MSDTWMGNLAAQDRYRAADDPWAELDAQQAYRGTPRLDPGLRRTPGDTAALPAAETFGQVVGDLVIPQTPSDFAMYALGAPARVAGKAAKVGALVAGFALDPSEAEAGPLSAVKRGIRAFHSSPHDFDKFDISKIGTGEGAQVYGHGLYFAENPKVSGQGGEYWQQFVRRSKPAEKEAALSLARADFNREAAMILQQKKIEDFIAAGRSAGLGPANYDRTLAELRRGQELLQSGKPVGPRTYDVNINAAPEEFLDWDKVINQQPSAIQSAVQPFFQEQLAKVDKLPWSGLEKNNLREALRAGDMSGGEFYRAQFNRGDPADTAAALRERGIPGIRYLDQGSRGAGDGSRNYVVFDPNIVEIMRKYGIVGAPAGTMGALAAQDAYSPNEGRM